MARRLAKKAIKRVESIFSDMYNSCSVTTVRRYELTDRLGKIRMLDCCACEKILEQVASAMKSGVEGSSTW